MYNVNTSINIYTFTTHSFLRAERLFSSLTWWLGSDRLTSGSESDRLLGTSSSSMSLLSWRGHRTAHSWNVSLHSNNFQIWAHFWCESVFAVLDAQPYLWAPSQRRLQQVAVLSHPDSEVAITFIHCGHTAAKLSAVGVAFSKHALSQLDQQVNLFLGVLRDRETGKWWCQWIYTVRLYVCVCVCVLTLADTQNSLCWFSSSCVSDTVAPGDVCVAR